jgi:hypothetical protein
MFHALEQVRDKGEPAQNRGAQNHARQDFANHLGLPQPNEDVPQQLRQPKNQQDDEKH